jgi:hypothetical protein
VADEDDRDALALELAQDLEQVGGLLRRQHSRRLVEDQDVGVPIERLQDLDPLLLAHRDGVDAGVRIHVELERSRQLAHATRGCAFVEQHAFPCGFRAEDDVLGHGHHRDEHEVLVHHADARVDRILRGREGDGLAVQPELALVGLVQPVQDVHQRRLAGAVLTEQRVNLAARQLEVDMVVGDDARERLDDPAHLENWDVGHRGRS